MCADLAVVTGGAGFIGSHLVDDLLANGLSVRVVDDFSSGKWENLAHLNAESRLEIEEADIGDQAVLERLFGGARYVFHMAVRNVRLSLRQPTLVHDVNATGTLNALKAAVSAGVERFLYCSSSEVNGTARQVPMPEDYFFNPETIYGASKLVGEYYANVFHKSGWLPTVVARPHNNYGPRAHFRGNLGEAIPRFIILAMVGQPPVVFGDGSQTRDFTYVTETAQYLRRLLFCDQALGNTFNVCRGQEVTILRIAQLISQNMGLDQSPKHLAGRPADVLRLFGDPSRLRALLGDSPSLDIEEGLAKTIAWYKANVSVSEQLLAEMQPENWAQTQAEPWMKALESRR